MNHRIAGVAALIVGLAACGSGSDDSPTSSNATGEIDETGEMEMEDVGHEHDHDNDAAADAIPWDGDSTPTVEVAVAGDPETGWDVAASVAGFSFSDPSAIDHVPGWGHTHVFVDGLLVSMSYEAVVHVDDLAPGSHEASVTLSRNDHADYSLDGELISATTSFTVPGEVEAADATFSVVYEDGTSSGVDSPALVSTGDVVEINVHSDVAETVHIHGYDRFLELGTHEVGTIRFTALIDGVFDIEMEESGILLFELEVG